VRVPRAPISLKGCQLPQFSKHESLASYVKGEREHSRSDAAGGISNMVVLFA